MKKRQGKAKSKAIHPEIAKMLLMRDGDSPDKAIRSWKKRTQTVCKPCWELKYCPYGPLVEQFPLIPIPLEDALVHNAYLKKCLKTKVLMDGSKLTKEKEKLFNQMLASFDPSKYTDEVPKFLKEASCRIFGHICPVYYMAEKFTETKKMRELKRLIPREIMLKVVRRDGQICQICKENVADNDIEFDHIIPYSKGGPTSVDNLRILCSSCNKKRSNSIEDLLEADPVGRGLKGGESASIFS